MGRGKSKITRGSSTMQNIADEYKAKAEILYQKGKTAGGMLRRNLQMRQ